MEYCLTAFTVVYLFPFTSLTPDDAERDSDLLNEWSTLTTTKPNLALLLR